MLWAMPPKLARRRLQVLPIINHTNMGSLLRCTHTDARVSQPAAQSL